MHEITDANRPFPQGLACLSRDAGTTMVSWACQEGRIHLIKGAQSHLELFSGEEGGGQWLYITSPHLDLISIFWVHHLLFDHRYELLERFFLGGGVSTLLKFQRSSPGQGGNTEMKYFWWKETYNFRARALWLEEGDKVTQSKELFWPCEVLPGKHQLIEVSTWLGLYLNVNVFFFNSKCLRLSATSGILPFLFTSSLLTTSVYSIY